MGWIPSGNGILRFVLSACIALPNSLWAKETALAEATEDVPMFIQEVVMGGDVGYVVAIPVPAKNESALVAGLAKENPESLTLLIQGADDPVLTAAAQTGQLEKISTFVATDLSSTPFLQSPDIPDAIKVRLKERLQHVTEFCRKEKAGLLWAFYNSSVISAFTAYSSSSVEAGVGLLAGMFLWNSFLITQPTKWEQALTKGGNAVRKLANKTFSLFGRELKEPEKNVFTATGQFGVAWAANSVSAATVLAASGLLIGPAQALWYGLLSNYNVWDPIILKKYRTKKVNEIFVKRYFAFQFLLGSLFEAASYAKIPYTQIVLATTVISGLIYLISGRKIERTYVARARILKHFFNRKNLEPPSCEDLLGPMVMRFAE